MTLAAYFFFITTLLCINQCAIHMLQSSRIISNQSVNIEEHRTVKLDCSSKKHLIAAWRVSLSHDNIYR